MQGHMGRIPVPVPVSALGVGAGVPVAAASLEGRADKPVALKALPRVALKPRVALNAFPGRLVRLLPTLPAGLGVGFGVGFAVGFGVCFGVGFGVGLGVGFGRVALRALTGRLVVALVRLKAAPGLARVALAVLPGTVVSGPGCMRRLDAPPAMIDYRFNCTGCRAATYCLSQA